MTGLSRLLLPFAPTLVIASSACGADSASDPTTTNTPTDTIFPAAGRVVQLAAGFSTSCGLMASGDLYCWGENRAGEVGDGTTMSRSTPVHVSGDARFTSVIGTHGTGRICAIDAAAQAYCWGYNLNGEVGDGTMIDRDIPTKVVGGLHFQSLATSYHTCGVTTDAAAYCWGISSTVPLLVAGSLRFASVVTGEEYSCALTVQSQTYCWGVWSSAANLPSTTPVAVAGAPVFSEISSGQEHVCGLTAGGDLHCWGRVNGAFSPITASPTLITTMPKLRHVVAGDFHTCGLTSDALAYCWIDNNPPAVVSATMKFAGLAAGKDYTCGYTVRGDVYCWQAYGSGLTHIAFPGQ